jgi:hypothetical protein
MSYSELEKAIETVRELLVAAYTRGEKDAIARIVQAAKSTAPSNGYDSKESDGRRDQKERAPTGAANKLIARVLGELDGKGASQSEIFNAADKSNPLERTVSFAGVKYALAKGRDKKLYRNQAGKWFLYSRG